MSRIKELLIYSETDKKKVRQYYNKTEEDVQNDLKILVEWMEKQAHLPKPVDIVRIESFLLRNKFRIEQTKKKLDNYYTYRGIYPQFMDNVDPECTTIRNARKAVMWVPLPKLLPTLERLLVFRFIDKEGSIYSLVDAMSYILMCLEIQLLNDYALVDRLVIDYEGITLKHITKMDPISFGKLTKLHQEALSGRVSYCETINLPPSMDTIINFFKFALPPKLFKKLRVHKNLESLYEVLPKEYMPKEYGGNQESVYELHEQWGKELTHHRDFFLENAKKVSNENLRVGGPINSDMFGVDGTFRKLNLD